MGGLCFTLAGGSLQVCGLEARGRLPQALEIVELARLLREDVDHEVHVVNEHPLGLVVAFDVRGAEASAFETEFDFVGNGLNLARVGTAAQNEIVGEGSGTLLHFENGKLLGFFFEAGLDGGGDLFFEFGFLHAVVGRWWSTVGFIIVIVLGCFRRVIYLADFLASAAARSRSFVMVAWEESLRLLFLLRRLGLVT